MKCSNYNNLLKNNKLCNSILNLNICNNLSLLYRNYVENVNNIVSGLKEKVFLNGNDILSKFETNSKINSKTNSKANFKINSKTNFKTNSKFNFEINSKLNSKPNPKSQSFISILYSNGVLYKTYLTDEEQLILKMAVLYNRGIVNLLRRRESIKNLFNKGLLTIYDNKNNINDVNNGLVCVSDVVKIIISNGHNLGLLNVNENDVNENPSINVSQFQPTVLNVSWCMNVCD